MGPRPAEGAGVEDPAGVSNLLGERCKLLALQRLRVARIDELDIDAVLLDVGDAESGVCKGRDERRVRSEGVTLVDERPPARSKGHSRPWSYRGKTSRSMRYLKSHVSSVA